MAGNVLADENEICPARPSNVPQTFYKTNFPNVMGNYGDNVLEELFVLKQLRCNAFWIFLLGRYNMSEY